MSVKKKKKPILLTNERRVLVGGYFCAHVLHLLDFDMDDIVSSIFYTIIYLYYYLRDFPCLD